MKSDIISFDLEHIPYFYVCGEFEGLQSWIHKKMYQPGNWEIAFVIKGCLYLEIEDVRYTVYENEYILVPPYKNIVGFKPCPAGSKFIWIHFFPKGNVFISQTNTQPSYYEARIPRQSTMFDKNHILSTVYQLLELSQISKGLVLDIAVSELLATVSDDYKLLIKHNRSASSKYSIENVRSWISAHLSEINSSQEIADAFNFTSIYLNRIFKKNFGISLYQYVIRQKIEKAKYLLESTDKTIYQISWEAYFKDSKNFSKTFKRRVGLTPRAYRDSYNQRAVHTPTYDPVIPVSDKIMEQVLKNDIQSTPYGKSPKK